MDTIYYKKYIWLYKNIFELVLIFRRRINRIIIDNNKVTSCFGGTLETLCISSEVWTKIIFLCINQALYLVVHIFFKYSLHPTCLKINVSTYHWIKFMLALKCLFFNHHPHQYSYPTFHSNYSYFYFSQSS